MKKKRIGLRRKIIRIICMLIAVMSVILMVISYKAFYDTYINFYYDKALGIVKMLANEIDGDQIARYVDTGSTDEAYDALVSTFNNVKANTSGLSYLYLMVPYEDHFVYVIDAYTDQDDMNNISAFGSVFEYRETEYTYLLPDVKAKSASTQIVYGGDAGFGRSISVWAPVFDRNGEVAAMVEGDYVLTSVEKEINSYVLKILFFIVMALAVITVIMVRVIDTGVTSPIIALTKYIDSYEKGNLTLEPVPFKEDNEIKWLSDSFGNMIDRMELYITDIKNITAERERIGAELNVATKIQADMLPRIFPAFPDRKEFDIYASMNPAKEVGGDFYDFFMVDNSHLAIVMADVSGKGVPAALFMVIGKTLIKDHTKPGRDLGEVFTEVNNLLCKSNSEGMFITAFEGVLDLVTGEFQFVNAGHEIPFLCKKGGAFEPYKIKAGFVLAGIEDIRYQCGSMQLEVGDKIFQYTDGIPEAANKSNEFYGMERLENVLCKNATLTPSELLPKIKMDLDEFVGDAPQFDDITMLCLEYKARMECGRTL